MFGQLKTEERGRGSLRDLYGMPVLSVGGNWDGFGGERRLRRAGQRLRQGGVVRVLQPRGGVRWEILRPLGLRPVDPAPLLRLKAPGLALTGLERRGLNPERSVLMLSGRWADEEMLLVAGRLSRRVRGLVVDAPAGERLAQRLRADFGMPILPRDHPAQLRLCFHRGVADAPIPRMELWGTQPELDGLRLTAPGLGEEDREDLSLLCALYQWGRLEEDGIKFT